MASLTQIVGNLLEENIRKVSQETNNLRSNISSAVELCRASFLEDGRIKEAYISFSELKVKINVSTTISSYGDEYSEFSDLISDLSVKILRKYGIYADFMVLKSSEDHFNIDYSKSARIFPD